MCRVCNNTDTIGVHELEKDHGLKHIQINVKQYDPTRTLTLRNAFVAEMNRRFKNISKQVTKAVVDEDIFGLKQDNSFVINATPGNKAFAFNTKSDKIKMFLQWLRQVEDAVLLEMRTGALYGTLAQTPWFGMYLAKAYLQGSKRAQEELNKAGMTVTIGDAASGMVYINPVSVEKLMLIFTRAFTELQGVTASMDAQISRILVNGLFEGQSPAVLARMINSAIIGGGESLGMDISYINKAGNQVNYFLNGKRRAEILARTEIIRAHHKGTIDEYRTWAVEGVYVLAEFVTAGDARVCPECAALQNTIWTLDQIENMIPVHPQCRCVSIPFVDTKRTKIGG